MKRSILFRLLCLSLTLLMAIPASLTGCGGAGEDETQPATLASTEAPPEAPDASGSDTQAEVPTEALVTEAPAADTEAPTEAVTEEATLSLEDYLNGNDLVVTPVKTKAQPVDRITVMGHELTDAAVILPAKPDKRETEAADLIRVMLKEAVGIEVPVYKDGEGSGAVELVIGVTDRDTADAAATRNTLTDEGYMIHAEGSRLFISGKSPRSTYNGVQSFLEDYIGCRFFSPTVHAVHEAGEIAVPDNLDIVYDPQLQFRCSFYQYVDADVEKVYKNNPLVYAGGHRVHTFQRLAEMTNYTTGQQPCLTDPAVYETVLRNVKATLRSSPGATVISVSQNDSYEEQLGCQCENCRALNEKYGTEGGALFEFVNRIARDIRGEFPDVWVETLAYRYTIVPPKDMVFEDNVLVMMCTMDLCCNHAIDDPSCPQNYRYAGYLENWSKICSHLSIWDYHTSFADYQQPFPIEDMLYDQIVYYANHNAVSLFDEGNYNSLSGQFEELRSYITSRLMWNTDETKAQYLADEEDFLKYWYGDGWVYIKRYMDIIAARASADGRHFTLYSTGKDVIPYDRRKSEDRDLCEALIALFDKAIACTTDEVQIAHLRKSSIQAYWYGYGQMHKKDWYSTYCTLMDEASCRMQTEGAVFTHK